MKHSTVVSVLLNRHYAKIKYFVGTKTVCAPIFLLSIPKACSNELVRLMIYSSSDDFLPKVAAKWHTQL